MSGPECTEAQAKTRTICMSTTRNFSKKMLCYWCTVLQQHAKLKALSCAVLCWCMLYHYCATAGCLASCTPRGRMHSTESHLLSVGPMNMRQFLQSSMVTMAHASMTYRLQSCMSQPRVKAWTGYSYCRIVMPTAEQPDRIKSLNPRLRGSCWAVQCWHHRSFVDC